MGAPFFSAVTPSIAEVTATFAQKNHDEPFWKYNSRLAYKRATLRVTTNSPNRFAASSASASTSSSPNSMPSHRKRGNRYLVVRQDRRRKDYGDKHAGSQAPRQPSTSPAILSGSTAARKSETK